MRLICGFFPTFAYAGGSDDWISSMLIDPRRNILALVGHDDGRPIGSTDDGTLHIWPIARGKDNGLAFTVTDPAEFHPDYSAAVKMVNRGASVSAGYLQEGSAAYLLEISITDQPYFAEAWACLADGRRIWPGIRPQRCDLPAGFEWTFDGLPVAYERKEEPNA